MFDEQSRPIDILCDTDDPYDFMDAAAIVSEFEEWFDTKNEECDILSFEYKEM